MLLEFKVSNYRSIGDEQVLSLVPSKRQKEFPLRIITNGKYESLNGLALYGSNGSGKSNFMKAIGTMVFIVNSSANTSSTARLPYDPFLLREGYQNRDTFFEITFVLNRIRYRYGFTYNLQSIKTEWLFRKSIGRETKLFEREGDVIDVRKSLNSKAGLIDLAIDATRENSLFLTRCDMVNITECKELMKWFSKLNVIDGTFTRHLEIQTASLLQNDFYGKRIKDYLRSICLNIVDVDVETKEFEDSDLPPGMNEHMKVAFQKELKGMTQVQVRAHHQKYNEEGNPTHMTIAWDWDERESSGSQKAMHLSGPILWTLSNGGILVIDEIEANLHPLMTRSIVKAFLDPTKNINNAQLIFTTHDANLLNSVQLRRDQIYFVEKNKWEGSELYSLSDFKFIGEKDGEIYTESERPDKDKTQRYLEGRYGAIPDLKDFNATISKLLWHEKGN